MGAFKRYCETRTFAESLFDPEDDPIEGKSEKRALEKGYRGRRWLPKSRWPQSPTDDLNTIKQVTPGQTQAQQVEPQGRTNPELIKYLDTARFISRFDQKHPDLWCRIENELKDTNTTPLKLVHDLMQGEDPKEVYGALVMYANQLPSCSLVA